MTLRDDYVMALEAENEQLREKIARLEETLGTRIETPMVLRLTGQEAKMFGILLKRELVTKQQALDVLYGHLPPEDEAEAKIVDVFVCKMRKKLTPWQIEIETVWGRGYRMPAQSKAAAAALLEQARAL
jgi:DNA-binding response OmpR family regulator